VWDGEQTTLWHNTTVQLVWSKRRAARRRFRKEGFTANLRSAEQAMTVHEHFGVRALVFRCA